MSIQSEVQTAIAVLDAGEQLSPNQAVAALNEIMEGKSGNTQIKTFLTVFKNPAAPVLSAMAQTMRFKSHKLPTKLAAVDTCGMGGDGKHWFNISTAAALVVAACGVPVAKHGNRQISSKSGSADVLAELGVNHAMRPEQALRCLHEIGFCFLFAPLFHPAMKSVASARRELGTPTVFNMLGPLTNPAGVRRQVVGIPDRSKAETIARTIQLLGVDSALVVNADCGADEVDVEGTTLLYQVGPQTLKRRKTRPADFGLPENDRNLLKASSAAHSAELIRAAFNGAGGEHNAPATVQRAVRHAIVINAAATLVVADATPSFNDGAQLAMEAIDSMAVADKLRLLAQLAPGE